MCATDARSSEPPAHRHPGWEAVWHRRRPGWGHDGVACRCSAARTRVLRCPIRGYGLPVDMKALTPGEEAQRVLERILHEFTPTSPTQPWVGGEMRMSVAELDLPVPELARTALDWAGYKNQRWEEKTAWRRDGTFRGRNVSLASTKFGLRFCVEMDAPGTTADHSADASAPDDPPTFARSGDVQLSEDEEASFVALRKDFVGALRKAARVFDKHVLAKLVDAQVAAGSLTLLNQNGRLRGGYQFFRWQAQAFIDGHGDPRVRKDMVAMASFAAGGQPGNFADFLFIPMNVGFCLNAMSTAYFSWIEHILVLTLPFTDWDPADYTVTSLIGNTWSEKWKRVIGIADPDAKRTFDKLTQAAERFRNLDAHGGFGKGEQALLVHTPAGTIPARLTEGANAIRATVISEAPSTFPEACAAFDEVDVFLRNGPTRLAMLWIEGGLQVPYDDQHRREIAEAMRQGEDAYVQVVDRFAELEDRINNFEW